MEKLKKFSWFLIPLVILCWVISYVIWGNYSIYTVISLVIGFVIIIFVVIFNFSEIKLFFSKKLSGARMLYIFQILLVLAVLIFVYLLSTTSKVKFDFTREKLYSLSKETKKLLAQISNEITIYYFKPFSYTDPVLEYIQNLLESYVEKNKHLKLKLVDPIQNRAMAIDYDIKENGSVVFESENGKITISPRKVIEQNPEDNSLIYKGEEIFTRSIKNLILSKPKNVYILQGHGEINIYDKSYYGFSRLLEFLIQENIKVRELNLLRVPEIPGDCNLIIIGNPRKTFSIEELDKLANYMENGGNILLLLEYETDYIINDILRQAGCFYIENLVVEDQDYLPQLGRTTIIPEIIKHEITLSLINGRKIVFMPTAVGILTLPENERERGYSYEISPLLSTSKGAWGEVSKAEVLSNVARKDKKDLNGPLNLAYFVKRVNIKNSLESRIGIVGDTDFINNLNIDRYSNFEFFINLVNYLLKREAEVGISPKTSGLKGFKLASSEKRFLQVMAFLPLILFILPGVIVIINRRRSRFNNKR